MFYYNFKFKKCDGFLHVYQGVLLIDIVTDIIYYNFIDIVYYLNNFYINKMENTKKLKL